MEWNYHLIHRNIKETNKVKIYVVSKVDEYVCLYNTYDNREGNHEIFSHKNIYNFHFFNIKQKFHVIGKIPLLATTENFYIWLINPKS